MATRKRTKTAAADTATTAAERTAASGTAASAAKRGARKRSVQAAQQQQRTSADKADPMLSAEARTRMVAEAAYYRALMRDFAPGHELEDWFDAEAEIEGRGAGS